MATKIYGLTTVKNEAHRYLESCLAHTRGLVDDIFVYDDQSTDKSVNIAQRYATVMSRSNDVKPFVEHEAEFRQASWDAFEEIFRPCPGDYVFAFDVDEFWYGHSLADIVAELDGAAGVVRRPEMYSLPPENPVERVDGFWDEITNIRIFPYQQYGKFKDRDIAGGSHPLYAEKEQKAVLNGHLLHYGYACQEDRDVRYERYINRGGHNPNHIRSIRQQPTIVTYDAKWGPMLEVVRGTM